MTTIRLYNKTIMSTNEGISLLGIDSEVQLHELLKKAFLQDNVKTFIDEILVSFNPCKSISRLDYKEDEYQKVASSAINHLQIHQKSQCIVLTGDSGSGKTELANKFIALLTKTTKRTQIDLAQNIVQAGKVLESFGNACTVASNNASRFIKLTELLFTEDVRLKGVYFHHYLLEKTRVVQHDKEEKNFHIFYQFLGGTATEELMEKYQLDPSVYHRYTGSDLDITEQRQKYEEELNNLKECFESLGFSQDNTDTISRLVAAIVHIGDLTFSISANNQTVEVSDLETLQKASSLLCVSPDRLKFALTTEITYVKGRIARRVRSISEVGNARDMLAMALYDRLFAWIVWKINLYLSPIYAELRGNAVSILDPFGFERLNVNGFEQLYINTANEHLMFLYNQIMFAWEAADHEAEGIPIQKVDFPENKDVIDFLMERPNGILSLLEQESKSVKGSDLSLVKTFSCKHRKHRFYSDVPNSPYPAFTIHHYAGKVTYASMNILTRNRNMLGGSIISCLQESQDDLLCRLFMVKLSPTGSIFRADQHNSEKIPKSPRKTDIKKMRRTTRRQAEMIWNIHGTNKTKVSKQELIQEQAHLTLTSQFRNSLSDVMQRNLKSELHFVRCIRPNRELIPNRYDDELVSAQLKYSGIMETVRMRQHGFPVRTLFMDFIERYKFLSYKLSMDVKYNPDTCRKILSHVDGLEWKIVKTKVLMKHHCREQLNGLLVTAYQSVIVVQTLFRGRVARRWYKFLKQRQQIQKQEVTKLLSQVISNDFYSHLCIQVGEEDARASCTDVKPDEQAEEKAIQILEGIIIKTRTTHHVLESRRKEYRDDNLRTSTPIVRQDPVDDQTTKQPSFVATIQPDQPTSPGSTHQSPLTSITDIFNFGPVGRSLETANQSVDLLDGEEDSLSSYACTDVFNSDNSNEELLCKSPSEEANDDSSLETPLSITDAMTTSPYDRVTSPDDSVTSPVRPSLSGKESNLSTFSFQTTLEADSDMDVAMETPGLWCDITCYERDKALGDFQVDRPVIMIDGSSNAFDVTRIGLGSLPTSPGDEKVEKVRRCIGKGIKLAIDVQGSMWVRRCSKNNVYVKGCFLSPEIQAVNGELPKGKLLKVFDFESFSHLLHYECEPKRYEPSKCEDILSSTKVYFSFVKNAIHDEDTPCWIEVKMAEPYRITQVAFDVAKERRRIAREKRGERTPPILRAKIGKSRQVIAVGMLEKKVRPCRYVDSFKYGRRGWARKVVSVNPFAFGNQDYLSPNTDSSNVLSRVRSQSSPEERGPSSIAGESSKDTTYDEVFESSPSTLETAREMGETHLKGKNVNDELSHRTTMGETHLKGKNVNDELSHITTETIEKTGQKIWAKEKLKTKKEQKLKGRVRAKTTS